MGAVRDIESDMKATATSGRSVRSVVLTADHGNATFARFEEFDPPLEPGPGECIISSLKPGFNKNPVHKGATPRSFVLASGSVVERSGTMILQDFRIVTLPGDLLNPKLRFCYT